jgi:heme-degrading monooxygenase HmoA
MYAQKTKIRVPAGQVRDLRLMIEQEYFPIVSHRPGFIAAYLLEQSDDEDMAEIILLWDTHSAAEAFTRTGSLASSFQTLSLRIPGMQIQRQGYIVRVWAGAEQGEELATVGD